MSILRHIFLITLLFVSNINALDSLSTTCSSHCTLADKNSGHCWNTTLAFFEQVLLNEIRGYISAQAGIAYWKAEHNQEMKWTEAIDSSVNRMMHIKPPDNEDEEGITNRKIYDSVVRTLIVNTKGLVSSQPSFDISPPCPLGCETEHAIYKRMFIGSMTGSVVLFVLTLVLSMYHYKSVKRSVKQETIQALQAYELNLTNKSKQTFKLVDVDI